jgi:hypothetical protein
MNPDELPIQELKENGLEDVIAANNYEIVFNMELVQMWIG